MTYRAKLSGLPTWTDADDIKDWLEASGLVADQVVVLRNSETQASKGLALIDLPNAQELEAVIARFDGAPLENAMLRCAAACEAKPKANGQRRVKWAKIFLGNVDFRSSEADLKEFLDGEAVPYQHFARVRDPLTGSFRGFVYAWTLDPDEFISRVNRKQFFGRRLTAELAHER